MTRSSSRSNLYQTRGDSDYQLERYAADPGFLSEVVRFDLPRLGTISGLRGVHLQCHIGTDTVSLGRLGASMTGLDFSAPAVGQARSLAARIGADARFVVFRHNITHVWNHGLGEIVTALLDAGMQITALTEHDSVPCEALPGKMERIGGGEWRLADQPWRLPHSYTLQAVKRG